MHRENLKRVKDLSVSPETKNLLGENLGKMSNDINQCEILYGPPPRVTNKNRSKQMGPD